MYAQVSSIREGQSQRGLVAIGTCVNSITDSSNVVRRNDLLTVLNCLLRPIAAGPRSTLRLAHLKYLVRRDPSPAQVQEYRLPSTSSLCMSLWQ